jgi:hypothetical protein
LNKQNNVCGICGGVNKNGKSLHIDHDHKTNIVRGLLCNTCNRSIGYAKDSIDILHKAISYLKETVNDTKSENYSRTDSQISGGWYQRQYYSRQTWDDSVGPVSHSSIA